MISLQTLISFSFACSLGFPVPSITSAPSSPLSSTHLQKVSGAHYNALDAVFNVRKHPDKSLASLASRDDTLVQSFKDLCPGGYTLEQLLEDMSAMSIL
jgi:hypothetical protein